MLMHTNLNYTGKYVKRTKIMEHPGRQLLTMVQVSNHFILVSKFITRIVEMKMEDEKEYYRKLDNSQLSINSAKMLLIVQGRQTVLF